METVFAVHYCLCAPQYDPYYQFVSWVGSVVSLWPATGGGLFAVFYGYQDYWYSPIDWMMAGAYAFYATVNKWLPPTW